jgi:AAA domain
LWPRAQDALPQAEWLIPSLVSKRSTCLLWAPEHSLKSFIADSAAFSLSSEIDGGWGLGGHAPLRSLIITEDAYGTVPRRQAWERAHGASAQQAGLWSPEADWRPVGSDSESITHFIQLMQPVGVDLIVLDPWIMFLGGLDESNPTETQKAIEQLHRLPRELEAAVIVVAHAGKDGKAPRGTNALMAAIHHQFRVERQGLAEGKPTLTAALINEHHKNAPLSGTTWWRGQPAGPSVAFRRIEEPEAREDGGDQDGADLITLAAVLRVLERGDHEWSTEDLAREVRPHHRSETADQIAARHRKVVDWLKQAAKGPLVSVTTGAGQKLRFRRPQG